MKTRAYLQLMETRNNVSSRVDTGGNTWTSQIARDLILRYENGEVDPKQGNYFLQPIIWENGDYKKPVFVQWNQLGRNAVGELVLI